MSARVALVGSGRVATALAGALRLAGTDVRGLWGRRSEAARAAAEAAGVVAVTEEGLAAITAECDVVIVAVSDRAIGEVAQGLAAQGAIDRRHVVLHCSGAMAAEQALAPLEGRTRGRGTLHPLRAIPDGAAAMRDFAGTHVALEGDEAARRDAEALCRALGAAPFELRAEAMPAYHGAAALASNGAVALLDAAVELALEAGIPASQARSALGALARGSLENGEARGTTEGLTGPIRRGDRETVERHLEAIRSPGLREIYAALGRRAVAIAKRHDDVDPARLEAIDQLLRAARSSTP